MSAATLALVFGEYNTAVSRADVPSAGPISEVAAHLADRLLDDFPLALDG
jgi:hypothetical protein